MSRKDKERLRDILIDHYETASMMYTGMYRTHVESHPRLIRLKHVLRKLEEKICRLTKELNS